MQFQVPQFTDIEDKVIGPFTLKQFLYLAGAGGVLFILFKSVKLFLFILLSIPIGGLAIALAFVKVNNRPFISLIKHFFGFLGKPDFYVWRKPKATPQKKVQKQEKQVPQIIKAAPIKRKLKLKRKEKLQELGWKVEIEK